jgi:hypothetical protein
MISQFAYLCRRMRPGNTALSLAAGLSTLGISVTGLAKLWFRFPDTPTFLTNRFFLAYALCSFFIGAAIWYYFDNADGKIIDILAVGLRLLGAGLVFYSCSQVWEVGIVVVGLMLISVLLHQHRRKTKAHSPSKPTGAPSNTLQSLHGLRIEQTFKQSSMQVNRRCRSSHQVLCCAQNSRRLCTQEHHLWRQEWAAGERTQACYSMQIQSGMQQPGLCVTLSQQ